MSDTTPPDVILDIQLPTPEATDLTLKAAVEGVSTHEFLGYHALRSAYGVLHPRVVAFDQRKTGKNRDSEG
jgi:hypothetical protein